MFKRPKTGLLRRYTIFIVMEYTILSQNIKPFLEQKPIEYKTKIDVNTALLSTHFFVVDEDVFLSFEESTQKISNKYVQFGSTYFKYENELLYIAVLK